MSDLGFHCFAPDWLGFGFSDKPQPGYGFDYTGYFLNKIFITLFWGPIQCSFFLFKIYVSITEKEFHDEFDRLLDVLGVTSPFYLVVQVWTLVEDSYWSGVCDERYSGPKEFSKVWSSYSQIYVMGSFVLKLCTLHSFVLYLKGFLVGSYGLTWAVKNPSRLEKLAILNSPLTVSSPLPGLFKQLRFVLYTWDLRKIMT